ncbi:MAG: hypothetical protein ACE5EC_02720, partial [Phycisphaerae bacterium]
MYDDWPQFRNSYLRRVCEAFQKKSKSLRYRGKLAVHAGVEVEGWLHLKKDALRIEGTLYYNGIAEDALAGEKGSGYNGTAVLNSCSVIRLRFPE